MTTELNVSCWYCGKHIPHHLIDRCYRQVIGWEKHRMKGGTNALAMREPQQVWMHTDCMSLYKRGITPGQQSLV